ncbi:MAG: ABC transporter permease [Desulfobacteraceae bacterium]
MQAYDAVRFSLHSLTSQRMRTFLTALGIAVGIAAVVLLTSLGEGIYRYVMGEFTQFGTNLIGITPGRTTTTGGSTGGVISNVRPLSLADARAVRKIRGVIAAVPMVQGNAAVEYRRRQRRTMILGVGSSAPMVWRMQVASGRFLPEEDGAPRSLIVLGATVRRELFGQNNPLGRRVRVGGESYRVIGVMAAKGQMLGFDLDDAVYIPAGRALAMFDRESLMEIDLLYAEGGDAEEIARRVRTLIEDRHGSEDFTVITQDQMLEVLSSVLGVLTMAVGALGGISLLVGAVGILTIMTIAVRERTAEIGLLRALGAGRRSIMMLFIGEATMLGAIGGFAGLILGLGGAWLLDAAVPALPTHTPWSYVVLAELLAGAIGLGAGVLPARHAARLDPIEALRAE